MTKQELMNMLMTMRDGKNDAIINRVLGRIDLVTEENIERLLDEKGGTPDVIMAYFAAKITKELEIEEKQKSIEEEQRREAEAQRLLEEQERARQLREKQAQDITYDYDLNRKLEQLVRGLRQKSEKEREGDLELSSKFFEDIPEDKLPQVLEFLKNELGFEFTGNEHGAQEQDGRDITIDTVTKEELEKGEVKLSISKEKLQSEKFKELLDDKELELNDKADEIEKGTKPEREEAPEHDSDSEVYQEQDDDGR